MKEPRVTPVFFVGYVSLFARIVVSSEMYGDCALN